MRLPQTYVPQVDRLSGGELVEGPGYRVLRPHGTTDHLLIATVAGRGRFGVSGAPDVVVGPGTVVLLAPGTPHDYGVESDVRSWTLVFSHFHPRSEWRALLDWPSRAPGIGTITGAGEVADRIVEQVRAAGRYSRSQQPRATLFGMNALESALLWCDTQNPRSRPIDERILRVLDHLDRHVADPLTVADLARVAQLSVSRFAHLFTRQLGAAPMAYLEGQRMALARQLLDLTGRGVAEIATMVGYADPLYFSTRFRHVVGTSPTGYRSRGGGTDAAPAQLTLDRIP